MMCCEMVGGSCAYLLRVVLRWAAGLEVAQDAVGEPEGGSS